MSPASPLSLEIDVHGLGRVSTIRGDCPAPTAGQALLVMSAGERADLDAVVTAWMPSRLRADLGRLSDDALAQVLGSIVAQSSGVAPSEGGGSAERPAWGQVAARISRGYGWGIAETLAMPWADFLAAAAALPQMEAADDLRAIVAANPTAESVDRLAKQASIGDASASSRAPWDVSGETKPEYRRRKMREAHVAQKAMRERAALDS